MSFREEGSAVADRCAYFRCSSGVSTCFVERQLSKSLSCSWNKIPDTHNLKEKSLSWLVRICPFAISSNADTAGQKDYGREKLLNPWQSSNSPFSEYIKLFGGHFRSTLQQLFALVQEADMILADLARFLLGTLFFPYVFKGRELDFLGISTKTFD